MAAKIDKMTKRWIRNRSDEVAVKEGARFSVEAASFMIWWVERHCRLYEGTEGPLIMHSIADQPEWEISPKFNWSSAEFRKLWERRIDWHLKLYEADEHLDWQFECHARIYGWQKFSQFHGRHVRRFRDSSIFIAKKNKKANNPDDPVPTPDGWKRFGDLKVGDQLFDRHGKICRVIQEHEWHENDEDAFAVEFSNGEVIRCNGEHLWYTEALAKNAVKVPANKWSGPKSKALGKGRRGYYAGVRTTWELIRTMKRASDSALNHRIPMQPGLECPDKELPLDPYVLGYFLGNGDRQGGRIACHTSDMPTVCHQFHSAGYAVQNTHIKDSSNGARVSFAGLAHKLRSMELVRSDGKSTKFIPLAYLRSSAAQRTALLQGLMDSDGCINKAGNNLVFSQVPGQLSTDVQELLATLGIKFSVKRVFTRPTRHSELCESDWIQFHEYRDRIECFRLKRKLDRQRLSGGRTHMVSSRSRHVHVKSIKRCEPFRSRCISVDSPDGTYLIGKTMLPTHNSPTMAANAMYLSVGDGEQGAKTFLLSKTGKQVRENACRHIFEMWKRSPLIHEESKFNQNDMRLYHLPTSSIIQPLSSDNKETRESNEGINGNTLVDEVHVVDEKTVAIVDRAGISRSEPIHMEFSTSGKNNSGYGRKRFDLAVAIQDSREVDTTLFAYVAAAPQETKPEELRNEPHLIRLGKMANPAWGHTVNPAEFLTDYRRSARSPGKMRDFMMYRLNVWQQEGEPFIRMRDWDACAVPDMRFEDFHGEECQCGLDMAVSNDLLAFSWIFTRDGKAHIFVDHWLPRVKGVEMNDIVPYLDWERQGWIRLLPGRVIDEDMVFDDIMARAEHVKIKSISYDPARSRYLTKKLDEMGYVLELFRQNNREFHPHVERLEKLIIGPDRETMELQGLDPSEWEPELCHPANPCLDWQVKHCQVDEDKQRYKRPVKPPSGEHKKIDGLVALVMGIRGLTEDLGALATPASAYADPNASWLKNLI